MGIAETTIIYGIIGAVVAAAMQMTGDEDKTALAQASSFAARLVCWPFFAPLLLSSDAPPPADAAADARPVHDATAPRIDRAERHLIDALESLDGVAGELIEPQRVRVERLCKALRAMRARLDEMENLLASAEFDEERAEQTLRRLDEQGGAGSEERARSVEARLRNIRRLEKMRADLRADFERAILKAEEISSQLRLLRFADQPQREAAELVDDIAATVDGLSEGLIAA
ncbi:MAG: hypothetical protein ACOCV2_09345 [Persicimonas sp.]